MATRNTWIASRYNRLSQKSDRMIARLSQLLEEARTLTDDARSAGVEPAYGFPSRIEDALVEMRRAKSMADERAKILRGEPLIYRF